MEGYASKLRVEIDEMLPGILNNGQINGQIERYEVSFTVNDNMIFGVKGRNNLVVETRTNYGLEPVESVESGDVRDMNHIMQIESEYIFNVFFRYYSFFICRMKNICCLFIIVLTVIQPTMMK